jgi:hypothetical protein
MRLLISAPLVAQLIVVSAIDAAEPDTCAVSDSPSKFNHQFVTLKGMAVSVNRSTSRAGRKEMTFLLTSHAGCGSGGVIVYFPGSVTVSNGDRVQVEGTFETQHLREGSIFNNELQATKIIPLPR